MASIADSNLNRTIRLLPAQRPRVVYIDHVARMSGGEIALARLLKALGDQVDAYVILGEDGPLVRELQRSGISVEVLPMQPHLRDVRRAEVTGRGLQLRGAISLLSYTWRLQRRIRQLKPDFVQTNSLKAALYGGLAGRLARVPVVWHVRDRIADDYLPRSAVRLVRLASHLLPTAILANSAATLACLPARRWAAVIYNPSVMPQPVIHDIAPDSAVTPAGTPGPLRVGIVGRLADWKGQHIFLQAFAEAFPSGDEEAWIIGSALFGEEEYGRSLHALAADLGIAERVTWRGFQQDVASELAQLDVLVHCSTTAEPFGQVVVEGMAAGLPVIAAAAGGPLEIITDGVDGVLTAPGDVQALSDALRRLGNDPTLRSRLVIAAYQSVQRFSPQAATHKLMNSYRALMHRTRFTMTRRQLRREGLALFTRSRPVAR